MTLIHKEKWNMKEQNINNLLDMWNMAYLDFTYTCRPEFGRF